MELSLLALGVAQDAINGIDLQESAGALPVVRSVSTGAPAVREGYRAYMDLVRDVHSATDKALHRHEQALAMQNQQLLLDQQSAGAEQVDALAAQRRLEDFRKMNAEVWSVPGPLWSRSTVMQKSALSLAPLVSELGGLLTNSVCGISTELVVGVGPGLTPSGANIEAEQNIADERPAAVRAATTKRLKELYSDAVEIGIKTFAELILVDDPGAAKLVDLKQLENQSLVRFLAAMQPGSVEEGSQPMNMAMVASTLLSEAKKKARSEENRGNKRAKIDPTDKTPSYLANRGPPKGGGVKGATAPAPFQGGGAVGGSADSGTGGSGGRGADGRGRFLGRGSLADRGGGGRGGFAARGRGRGGRF
jgi:hypothetical protein